jgi:hypothetical protein
MLVSLLAGCASLPPDQACRAGIEKESEVLAANGYILKNHRRPDYIAFLSDAEINERSGDYESCLDNLDSAVSHQHARMSIETRSVNESNRQENTGRGGRSGRAKD